MIIIDANVLVDWDEYELDPAGMYGASALSRAELEWGIRSASDPLVAAKRIRKLRYLDAGSTGSSSTLRPARPTGVSPRMPEAPRPSAAARTR